MTTQSPASTLPAELISHVLRLSLDGLKPLEERRDLFVFGVCCAWYLTTLDWTRFVVASDKEVKALVTKLERDEREQRKAVSGRTNRSTVS